jgi:hypothetical protein
MSAHGNQALEQRRKTGSLSLRHGDAAILGLSELRG